MQPSDCHFFAVDEEDMERESFALFDRGVLTERNIRHRQFTYPHLSASAQRRHHALQQRVNREKLRRKRMVRQIEYQRLRNMVPSIAKKPLVSKVTVIEEAIRYIDHLHEALLLRLKTKGLPSWLQADVDVNQLGHDNIKNLVFEMINQSNRNQVEKPRLKTRVSHPTRSRSLHGTGRLPSYLAYKTTHRKRCT